MNYIDDFTEILIVYNNLKQTKIDRKDLKDLVLDDMTSSMRLNTATDTFIYTIRPRKFRVGFKGNESDVKTLGVRKVVFTRNGQLIGEIKIDETITPKRPENSQERGIIYLESGF